jgi:beta-glucanase (GH16 family)/lysophospholipase L1-like esterase
MPLIIEDRVKETTTSTGTGSVTLGGSLTGFRRFADVCAVGDTVYAAIVAVDASGAPTGDWEIGLYTYISANTLSRTTVHTSSNNDGIVNFGSGIKLVYIDFTSAHIKALSTTNVDNSVKPYGLNSALFTSVRFQDEFDGTTLNSVKWDTKLWYEASGNSTINYSVGGGCLNIWVERDATNNFFNRAIPAKFYQKYGYYEIEAQLPSGVGVQPAFWLFSHDLANERPQIDVMKAFGAPPWQDDLKQFHDYRGAIYLPDTQQQAGERRMSLFYGTTSLSNAFHKYGMLWEPDGVTFFFDGQQLNTKLSTTVFNNRLYPILSVFMGTQPTDGIPDATVPTGPTNAFRVNYIRVWQLANAPAGSDNPAPPTGGEPGTPGGGTTIIGYYGDSTIKGWDATIGDGTVVATPAPLVMQNALGTGYAVNNRGVHGANTSELIQGIDGHDATWANEMANTSSQYVIVNHCLNDASAMSLSTYQANLRSIVDMARARGKTVIFETPNPADAIPALANFVNGMKSVAIEKTVPIIDQYAMLNSYMANNNIGLYTICPDGLHPSQATYTRKGQFAATRFLEIRGGGSPEPGGGSSGAGPLGQDASQWVMTFEDHFNSATLDRTKWTDNGGPRVLNSTPGTWKIENSNLVMCYQPPFQRGNCTIMTDPQGTNINGGFEQTYGFFEARIKCPYGPYVFPAFWLFRNDTREIDIMENFSGDDSGQPGGTWRTTDNHPINAAWTIHRSDTQTGIGSSKLSDNYYQSNTLAGSFPYSWLGVNVIDLSSDYHTYACEWEAGRIRFFFDGRPWRMRDGTEWFTSRMNEMNLPMYLMLDFWIDSRVSDGGCPRGFGPWEMRVDYVRVWRRK